MNSRWDYGQSGHLEHSIALVDAWLNCTKCGHRFGAHLASCPQCGAINFAAQEKVEAAPRKKGWSTGKKVAVGVGIGVGAFFALIIGVAVYLVSTGAVPEIQTDSEAGDTTQVQAPVYSGKADRVVGISEFGMTKQGSLYQIYYRLTDSNLAAVTANAQVSFKVATVKTEYDLNAGDLVETKTTIYEQEFNVSEDEYEAYTRSFTGAETGEMYLWMVDANTIASKAGNADFGEATITVTLENGKSFSADESVYFG